LISVSLLQFERREMAPDLYDLIRCADCLEGNLLLIGDPPQELSCRRCASRVFIVDGIPRFAGQLNSYVSTFGRQWNRYDVARPAEDDATFKVKTAVSPAELAGRLVLDAGCGGGRYACLVGAAGARVIGVDLSAAVVRAKALCASLPNVLILQADLLELPLADAAFDLVYSIGVLHHTPDPRRAFAEIARRVKPGGRLAVWMYRRNTPPQEWLNSSFRSISTHLPAPLLETGCAGLAVLGGIVGLNQVLNKIANFSNHPDWTLRVCDNFDWYAPRYQSHHSPAELKRWFTEEGFEHTVELSPAKKGSFYTWAYTHNLIIGSGVNVAGTKKP
jgi:SAM-dependent methyltransferase